MQLLRSTSSGVEKLAAKLTDTAELMSDTRSRTQSVQYQRSAENGEILQREWAAKVRDLNVVHVYRCVYVGVCTCMCVCEVLV